jgi:hypothetical protein
VTCSCAQPGCGHLRVALGWLVETQSLVVPNNDSHRSSSRLERVSLPHDARPAEPREPAARGGHAALAEALDDVVTAVVRAGALSDRSASVDEMLSRVAREAGSPLPLGVQRWIGRLREAFDHRDLSLAAHALAAASAFSRDLREPLPDQAARVRLASWLGAAPGVVPERFSDRVVLEIAREWVSGTERQQIERRYLIDLGSGECFREERARRAGPSSVGTCPRLIGVGFAQVEPTCAPRRMHLLQYTTTPSIDNASWEQVAAWGQRDSEAVAASYRSSLEQHGALSEPFALVVPRALEQSPDPQLLLDRGGPLPLGVDDDSGLLRRFLVLAQGVRLGWVAGRLYDRGGKLHLKPLAAGIQTEAGLQHERL